MKKWIKYLSLSMAALLFVAALTSGIAFNAKAFGDYNDYDYSYDYDSGSDWDSSSSDWGSSWDDDDDDYSYSSSSYSDSGVSAGSSVGAIGGGLSCCSCPTLILIIVIVVIIIIVVNKRKKNNPTPPTGGNGGEAPKPEQRAATPLPKGATGRHQAKVAKSMPNRTNEIASIIVENDELFTEPDFITYAKDVYLDIQDAWCKRDLTPVQPVLHSNLFQRTVKQIEKKIQDGVVPHLDRITVDEAYMTAYRKDAQYEYVTVYLSSRMIDYQVQESTGQILFGDKDTRWEIHYLMTFMRSLNVKTPEAGAAAKAFNCPNCGGTMPTSNFGVCPFCGSTVKSGEYGWVLSDFNAVKDSTPDAGIQL